jgi:ADP-L-glycero-D-manno-heptose 6-epimerase
MIILTGSSGFIGQNFLKQLSEPVICVEKDDCFKFLSSFDRWDEVSLILHQGAISSTTERNIATLHHHNVAFTLQLFDYAIKYQIPVKFASSASVYGNTNGQINPLNYYAITKLQIDYFIQDNLDKFSHISSYRYFNVYGSGEDHKGDQASPISKFTKQIKETGKLKLFEGSDKFLRDFVCVNDIVNIVLNNEAPSGIYDLGTGNPISFQEVAELVAKKEGGEIEYIPFPEHLQGKYQTYTCADNQFDYNFITVENYLFPNESWTTEITL